MKNQKFEDSNLLLKKVERIMNLNHATAQRIEKDMSNTDPEQLNRKTVYRNNRRMKTFKSRLEIAISHMTVVKRRLLEQGVINA